MTVQQWFAIAGALCGSLGSIITAFSLNATIRELNFARQGLAATSEALASNQRDVPFFEGFDDRIRRAQRQGMALVWAGVLLLSAGFVLQAISTVLQP